MPIDEILTALESLSPEELQVVQQKLDDLHALQEFEETPEMLAAIEEGLRSSHEEPSFTIEDLQEDLRKWNSEPK